MSESTISTASVEALRANAATAHERYSEAWQHHLDAEATLAAASGVRVALVTAYEAKKRALTSLKRQTIGFAIQGANAFSMGAATVVALASELALMETAIKQFNAFAYQEALLTSLAAKLEMLETQHLSESARYDLHVAQIYLGLSTAAAQDGGLKVEMGSATDGLRRLVHDIGRNREAARSALKAAEVEAIQLQDAYKGDL